MNGFNLKKWGAVSSLFLPFILYLYTLMPGLGWGDSASFTWRALGGKIHFFQRAGHGVYILVGYLFSQLPFLSSNLPYSQNLISAFFAALALLFFYFTSLKITRSVRASLIGTFVLAVSHTFWFMAVINDSYSLFALTTILQIYLCLCLRESQKFYYFILLLSAGFIGFFNHMLTALFIPVFVGFAYMWFNKKKTIAYTLLAVIIGGVFLMFLTPFGVSNKQILLKSLKEVYQYYIIPDNFFYGLLVYPLKLWYQFPLSIIFIPSGLKKVWRSDRSLCLFLTGLALSIILFPPLYYSPARNFNLLIISFIIAAVFFAAGWPEEAKKFKPLYSNLIAGLMIISPVICYYNIPRLADRMEVRIAPSGWTVPRNGSNRYFMWPSKKNYTFPEEFANESIRQIEPDSLLITDEFSFGPVWYQYALNKNKRDSFVMLIPPIFLDLNLSKTETWLVIQREINKTLASHKKVYLLQPVDLVFYTRDGLFDIHDLLKSHYEIKPTGMIYEVKLKGE